MSEAPPSQPSRRSKLARCECGNPLGVVDGQYIFVRHKGRSVDARLPANIKCEICHRRWRVTTPAESPR